MHWRAVLLQGALWACLSGSIPAQAPPAADFRLSFPAAHQHYVEVEARYPCAGKSNLELFLPVWTPGSYMVRDYSRQLEQFRPQSASGQPLKWEKTRKNRWKVDTQGLPEVVVSYRVYCREMSVRTSWVEQDYALLVGAQVFLTPLAEPGSIRVKVELPSHWKRSESGLPLGADGVYQARDLDQLLDCPILCGSPAVYDFSVGGVPHRLVNEGEAGCWDGPKSSQDAQKIVQYVSRFWGDMPYAKEAPGSYTILNLLTQSGGGLEHKNSTVLMGSRWAQRVRKDYLNWLSLVAHEYFHAWNVKTLRPVALGPFDYENEVYTPSLWVAEGLTAYYDNLLVRRVGFSTPKEYLDILSKDIESLQTSSGRQVQSLRMSSQDAWIKFYRPDENSANSSVSYYVKGSLVGFLLDARIRSLTEGKRSLDDVMRLAYQRYSGATGYREEQFRALAEEVAGASLETFFEAYVDGTQELDYKPALQFLGLRFKPVEAKKEGAEGESGWLGAQLALKDHRLVVTSVRRSTPAYQAGLNVDDELLALDEFRIAPDKLERLDDRLKAYRPGTQVTLLVSRRDRLMKLSAKLEKKPAESWALEFDPQASEQAQLQRSRWLESAQP